MPECDNCGEERRAFERCQHCGYASWRDDSEPLPELEEYDRL